MEEGREGRGKIDGEERQTVKQIEREGEIDRMR